MDREIEEWSPDPWWQPLRAGGGSPATVGLWSVDEGGRRWVVKRLEPPDDPAQQATLHDPRHAGYWRREAEVALHPELFTGPGLVAPRVRRVDEDPTGVTMWTEEVGGTPPTALFAARALGRFAARSTPGVGWASTSILAGRLGLAERNGGWPTLRRTSLAKVTEALWDRREHWLGRLAGAAQGQLHGDVTPGNLLGSLGEDVVAIDWQCWGSGPVGADLGYYSLSCREDFEVLLEAFVSGLAAAGHRSRTPGVAMAARVTAAYTVVSRAEWALAVALRGEAPLTSTYRHPSVAPHLRALQRQLPHLEFLLRG